MQSYPSVQCVKKNNQEKLIQKERFIELENSIKFHLNIHYVNTYNITLKISPATYKTMDREDQFKHKKQLNI